MVLTIIALSPEEKFLQFLDPDLCELEEKTEYGGLRTLELTYTFQDFQEDKKLFQIGNKIWVQGDQQLTDCLYVINTEVKEDIYKENTFTLEVEEVLVELNYTPLFLQTELANSEFRKVTTNGRHQVVINWNSLNYWFGDYFNIGIVQDCISEYSQRITVTGSMTRMRLLRQIEEDTGNVFVTRYEKDVLDNTIHRYLDFLNPINVSKNWSLNMEYTFQSQETLSPVYDEDDNPCSDDNPSQVVPYSTDVPAESVDEDEEPTETETEESSTYNPEDDQIYPYENTPVYTPLVNLDPNNCSFRITYDGEIVGDLEWECSDAGLDEDNLDCVISLCRQDDMLGVVVNNSSFAATSDVGLDEKAFIEELNTQDYLTILNDNKRETVIFPDGSHFEIYDNTNKKLLFQTELNINIGTVHEEVLDFGYNLENIEYEIDETDTYNAISPVLTASDADNGLNPEQMDTLINRWLNLEVKKGNVVPMIVQKQTITGTETTPCVCRTCPPATGQTNAARLLGTKTTNSNYWAKPFNPNDNLEQTNKSYEYWRATAYWKAPYTKNKGEFHITTDTQNNTQYTDIYTRTDTRNERRKIISPKIGTTETSDEDVYMIYNQVALYLRDHETPKVNLTVDVANLRGGLFNQYELHDKVYIKIPDSQELITARVTATSKTAHDIAKNTVTLSNYTPLNTIRTITNDTFIECDNISFNYPRSKTLTARLVNIDYDKDDYWSVEHPANKLITFTVYNKDNGSNTWTGKVYTTKTNAYGYASIVLRLDPGDYDVEIQFSGDEVYTESAHTVQVNVAGTIDVVPQMKTKETKSKTTAKTTKTTTKTVKEYFTKCGLSKDKKKICAVAKPSASVSDAKYRGVSMTQWYKTVFKNKCPECGRTGTLRFDGGKSNKCITSSGAHGRGYKVGVPEHEITCIHCDSDFDGVTGLEKNYGHSTRLKTLEKPKKSSKAEFGKLVKGKLVYKTTTKTTTSKNTTDSKNRYIRASGIPSKLKKLASTIVGNSTGIIAAKKIATWVDKHIVYAGYSNFQRKPSTVYSKGSANCCDGTRFLFTLLDAAGCCQYFNLYYVHVPGHVYGQIVTKKSGKKRYVDTASDYHGCWGYICRNYRGRSQTKSKYPKLPF